MVSKTLLRNLDFIVGVMGSWGGLNVIISFILLENFNSAILPYQDLNLPWCLGSCSPCSVYFLNLLNWTIYWVQACILLIFFFFLHVSPPNLESSWEQGPHILCLFSILHSAKHMVLLELHSVWKRVDTLCFHIYFTLKNVLDWSVIDIQHFISFWSTTQWLYICIYYQMITIISLVNICHTQLENVWNQWELLRFILLATFKY